jgi:hypothetical protein
MPARSPRSATTWPIRPGVQRGPTSSGSPPCNTPTARVRPQHPMTSTRVRSATISTISPALFFRAWTTSEASNRSLWETWSTSGGNFSTTTWTSPWITRAKRLTSRRIQERLPNRTEPQPLTRCRRASPSGGPIRTPWPACSSKSTPSPPSRIYRRFMARPTAWPAPSALTSAAC